MGTATTAPKRIYLETEALRKEHWPSESAALERMVGLAHERGVEVYLPEPVEIEREEQWFRDLKDLEDGLDNAVGAVRSHLGSNSDVEVSVRPEATTREAYRERARQKKTALGLKSCPFPKKTTREFFEWAAKHTAPFAKKSEKGFRDAVIYSSVIEHLQSNPVPAALVTRDGDFESTDLRESEASLGLQLDCIKSVSDVSLRLEEELPEKDKHHAELERREAKKAVEKEAARLEEFAKQNLDLGAASFPEVFAFGGVQSFKFIKVKNVELGEIPKKPEPAVRVPITVIAAFDALVWQRYRFPRRSDQYVYYQSVTLAGSPTTLGFGPIMESVPIPRDVRIEARVTRNKSGYQNVELLSAHWVGPLTESVPPAS